MQIKIHILKNIRDYICIIIIVNMYIMEILFCCGYCAVVFTWLNNEFMNDDLWISMNNEIKFKNNISNSVNKTSSKMTVKGICKYTF